jgi:hypothetical protein
MKHVLVPNIGLLGLADVRDVIEQKPEEVKVKAKHKEEPKQLESGNPELDAMSLAWIRQQQEEIESWSKNHDEDEELDGGRFS